MPVTWCRVMDPCLLHHWAQLLGEAEQGEFDCAYLTLQLSFREVPKHGSRDEKMQSEMGEKLKLVFSDFWASSYCWRNIQGSHSHIIPGQRYLYLL